MSGAAEASSGGPSSTGEAMHEEEALGKAYDGRLLMRLWPYIWPYRWQVLVVVVSIVAG